MFGKMKSPQQCSVIVVVLVFEAKVQDKIPRMLDLLAVTFSLESGGSFELECGVKMNGIAAAVMSSILMWW